MTQPIPKELRRARLAASAVKGLTVKCGAHGALLWYWEPNRAEKAHGWTSLKFGPDKAAALAGAESRNADIAAWRRGDPEPGGMEPAGRTLVRATHQSAPETIAQAALRYQRQHLAHQSANWQRVSASYVRIVTRMFGDLLPSDVQPRHIARWTDAMRGRGDYTGQGRQCSDHTAHARVRFLKALLAWIANPHEKFAQPKGRANVWELDDRAAFIAAAYDLGQPGMALAMKLAYYTAARTAMLLQFTEAQLTEMKHLVDPQTRAFLADKAGKVWGWQFIDHKEQVPLHIPFEPDFLGEIRAALAANRAADRAATPPRLLTHLLVNPATGKPWLYRHFNRTWNAIKDRAVECTGRSQIDALTWHDLRRTRVVDLKRQGYSHDRIATLTGHAAGTIDQIMETYGPIDANMTARLIVDSHQQASARRAG